MTALRVRLVASLAVIVLLAVAWLVKPAPPVQPVSNPGNGIEATLQPPPPRFDWTDDE